MNKNNIDAFRKKIDKIDNQLRSLFNERAELAKSIGFLKKNNIIYRPDRENYILNKIIQGNEGPLSNESLVFIFTQLISACRAVEHKLNISCLGPKGTFSEEAVVKKFGNSVDIKFCETLDHVFDSVENTTSNYGIVPIENTIEGSVGQTLDLLAYTKLRICGEIFLDINQNFMSLSKNKKLIKKIYSHSQSLAQCKNWIQKNFPNAKKIPVSSNSEAALLASKNKDCAVIGNLNAGKIYGLKIIEKNIQDYSDNKTRFILLGPEEIRSSQSDKTSIVFSSNNKPGSLFKILEPLAKKNINLTKLESRPIKSSNWEYFIYLDLSGHMTDKKVKFCLDSIKSHTKFFKILGSYPRSIL